MTNRAKQKGTKAETDLVNALKEDGYRANRLALAGGRDVGDVEVLDVGYTHVIEVKDVARWDAAGWIGQALVERDHYCESRTVSSKHVGCCVVIKRRGKGDPRDWYVLTTVREMFDMGEKS